MSSRPACRCHFRLGRSLLVGQGMDPDGCEKRAAAPRWRERHGHWTLELLVDYCRDY
ncbi:hypothetical protein E2C01_094490 [Portunus trituberculatus]|uniref:Uncharacterized protein n=1 Tax=Portunus trituberculatus TaxID=210409 RepID=A0A5B7K3C5_PORTR|nr:hypothetical protein [Portunus trituberculatus]